jgi:hypothetical protein
MQDPTTPRDENTMAVYSVFCGLLAVPTVFLLGFGILFGVLAIVLGRAGLRQANAGQGRRELAIAGIALGIFSILLGLLLVLT